MATSTTTPAANDTSKAKTLTAIEAITKISKILSQLAPSDRKRVLAFVSESNEGSPESPTTAQ